MSKRLLTLVIIVVVLGGLIGGYFFVTRPKPAPALTTGAKPELSKGDNDKIEKIVLSDRPEGTLTLARSGKDWTVNGRKYALDSSNLDDLLYSFSALYAERVIQDKPTDLAQYGLQPPQAVAQATFSDGSVHTLLLGNKTPANNTYYLQVKNDPKVYSVWMNNGEHFHWMLDDLRDKKISPTINYDELTYLKLVERDGRVIELQAKSPDESKSYQLGFSKFLMIRPYPYPRGVDSQKEDAFVKGSQSIAITGFVADNPTSLAPYGLDHPWGEVLVRDKSNQIDFLFGKQKDSSTMYFMMRGNPSVYTLDPSVLSFMDTKPFDLVDKFTFIPNIDDVDRIDITAAGATHTLVITRTTQKATEKGASDTVVATYTADGKKVEEDPFKKFYQVLIGLQVEGEVQHQVADRPEVSVRFTLNKGTDRSVTVNYAPYDRDFDAIFMGGKSEFALTKLQLSRMLDKLDQLIKGQPVSAD